ncbi:hypothetical protein V5R04_06215 [Jonesiaceae bacterium BS-20]|uniref:Uncharacterized protein n=1 Tax=Jonesiaceae bacterium BS-20 TaxID=3120821 RepID=A0AAU7DXD7_9MICO
MLDFIPTVYSVGQGGGDLQSEVVGAQDFSMAGDGLIYVATAVHDVVDATPGAGKEPFVQHFTEAIVLRTASGEERLVQLNPDANGQYFDDQAIINLQAMGFMVAFSSSSDVYLVDQSTRQVIQFANDALAADAGDEDSMRITDIVLTDSRISWVVQINDQAGLKETIYTSDLSGSDTMSMQVSSATELLDNGTGLTFWTGSHDDYRKVEWKY